MFPKKKIFLLLFLITSFLFIFTAFFQKPTLGYWIDGGYSSCGTCTTPNPGYCSTAGTPTTCNSTCVESPSSCDCAQSGASSWWQYKAECKLIGAFCDYAWVYNKTVGSTGDKCGDATGGNVGPYLYAGSCTPTVVGNQYKTCCNGSSLDGLCTQSAVDTTNPPWEGSCPSGSTTVMCLDSANTGSYCENLFGCNNCNIGGGVYCTNSACGTNACQAISPLPTPTPTPST